MMDEFVVRDLAEQLKALVGGISDLNDTLGEKFATLSNEEIEQPEGYLGATGIHLTPLDNNPVEHPSHYTAYKGIEVIQLTEQMNFNRGNAVKYLARAGLKSPETEIQDLEKARQYIDFELARLKRYEGGAKLAFGAPEESTRCRCCAGKGVIYYKGDPRTCPDCNGTGENN